MKCNVAHVCMTDYGPWILQPEDERIFYVSVLHLLDFSFPSLISSAILFPARLVSVKITKIMVALCFI